MEFMYNQMNSFLRININSQHFFSFIIAKLSYLWSALTEWVQSRCFFSIHLNRHECYTKKRGDDCLLEMGRFKLYLVATFCVVDTVCMYPLVVGLPLSVVAHCLAFGWMQFKGITVFFQRCAYICALQIIICLPRNTKRIGWHYHTTYSV